MTLSQTGTTLPSLLPLPSFSPVSRAQEMGQTLQIAAIARSAGGSLITPLLTHILLNSADFEQALSRLLARSLHSTFSQPQDLELRFERLYRDHPDLAEKAALDLSAITKRDPAMRDPLTPFLFAKGYHALQTHRLAHALWREGQGDDALLLQFQSSIIYGLDIHPAAQIGHGILIDHGTGVVIGETATIGDNVTLFHNVTLGGTGKDRGDRHPKVAANVMIGAGASLLGPIHIGEGARIGAGSIVLTDVPPHTTFVGVAARMTPRNITHIS